MTWNHDWCTEWRVAFVTRTLDEDEQSRYADHLPHCPDCTLAIAALADDIALLSLGVVPLEAGPALDPVVTAARIIATAAPRDPSVDAIAMATAQSVAVHDALGLLEILRDESGRRWAARLRGVPHRASTARFRLSYVDGVFEVHRCTLRADGVLVPLPVAEESPAVLGATLTVERDGAGGVVVGHLVIGG